LSSYSYENSVMLNFIRCSNRPQYSNFWKIAR